jgi:glycerophosphoryl diester phosphodiesterase
LGGNTFANILTKPKIFSGILKALLIAITAFVVAYLAFGFSFGGFGSKPIKPLFSDPADSALLFAHRGVVENFPENSLESIGEAKRLGFRAVEFDLRKSADDDFILFHDPETDRMLGKGLNINKISTSELDDFPLIQNGKPGKYFIPTLEEVLDQHSADFIFYFDLKLSGFKEADQIVEIIRKYNIENRVIVASADALFVFYVEYKYPEIITALEGFNAGKEWIYPLIPKNLRPDFLSGFLNRIDENHVEWLRKNELLSRRIVYGIDSSNFISAKSMGIKHMIMDYDSISPAFNELRIKNAKE